MGNSIFLNLGLKETVGSVLKKIGATARDVFGDVDRNIKNTQTMLHGLGKPIKLMVDTSELRNAQNDLDRLGSKTSNGIGIGGIAIGSLVAQGVSRASRFAFDTVGEVLGSGMEGLQQRGQFEVMAGDKPGDKLFADLTKYINDSVFGNSVYGNASTLMGFGAKTEDVLPDIKMLAEISRGNESKLNSLALVFGQTMAAEKLTGGDLLQYIGVGFNPLQEISRTTGKSYAQLRKEMEAGLITFDMVKNAFKTATSEGGRFYGMMAKVEKSSFGKKQAILGNIDSAKMQMGIALDPTVNRMLDFFRMQYVDKLPALVEKAVPVIDKLFQRVEEILPHVTGFADSVFQALKPLGGLVLSKEVADLATTVLDLGKSITDFLKPAVKELTTGIKEGVGELNKLLEKLNLKKETKSAKPKPAPPVNEPFFEFDEWDFLFMTRKERLKREKQTNSGRPYKELPVPFFEPPGAKEKRQKEEARVNLWSPGFEASFVAKPTPGPLMVSKAMFQPPATEEKTAPKVKAAEAVSDKILGGGQRVVNITFRNMIENWYSQARTEGESRVDVETKLEESLARILAGVPR